MPDYSQEPGGLLFFDPSPASDRHPFGTGNVTLPDGTEARIALWWVRDRDTGGKRKASNGNTMVSCKITLADEQEKPTPRPSQQALDGDIPF